MFIVSGFGPLETGMTGILAVQRPQSWAWCSIVAAEQEELARMMIEAIKRSDDGRFQGQ